MKLSIVVEWANTRLNSVPRAWTLFAVLERQWRAIHEGTLPDDLAPPARALVERLDRVGELIVVSGSPLDEPLREEIRRRLPRGFEERIHVAEGSEYYALKNVGAELAGGDLLLFVDSDVEPDEGWLAHLLGSFAAPGIDVVCGQTYVRPEDVYSAAFALGWTYPLRRSSVDTVPVRKFYANTIAFRTAVFRDAGGFPPLFRRTRGAASLLGRELSGRGIPVWENRGAAVAHPPPADLRHLVVRGVAHGRDQYMKWTEERTWSGLARSTSEAALRLGRAFRRIFGNWRRVGLRPWEVPAAAAVCTAYYTCFALGGILSHVSPAAMGRRFRV